MRDDRKGINARERSNCGVGVLMDMTGEKSHEIIEDSLEALENLDHRGARGAEENTGDGAGILLQKPHRFFVEEVEPLERLEFDDYGVGQVFMPQDEAARQEAVESVEKAASDEGFEVVAWRDVPTDNSELGESAVATEPDVWQFFVTGDETGEELDTSLYVLRRVIEKETDDNDRFYVCSLDRRKVVYKGLLTNSQVRTYYKDLRDKRVETSLALVHSRFSTNTLGSWELAHPFRNIIHNGEINTLRGNLNWMATREADLETDKFDVEKLKPVTHEDQSDTAVVDNVLELLVEGGRELPHALRMLIPEAWNKDETMDDDRRDWYDYHSTVMEPWDGPALVAFTDGYSVGAVLDRNGLRPCRYLVTEDDRLVMASETGVLETRPTRSRRKDVFSPDRCSTPTLRKDVSSPTKRSSTNSPTKSTANGSTKTASVSTSSRLTNPKAWTRSATASALTTVPSDTPKTILRTCSSRCRSKDTTPSALWVTTHRFLHSPAGTRRFSRTSNSCSRRSRTHQLTITARTSLRRSKAISADSVTC